MPFLIKPLSIFYFLKRILRINNEQPFIKLKTPEEKYLKNGVIKEIMEFGEDYNTLWASLNEHILVAVNRNAAYMNWRYVQKPGADYAKYGYYKEGELKGIVIFTLQNKHNGSIGYLMELLYFPHNKSIAKELLKFAEKILKKNKADLILAWCYSHSFNYSSYKSAGYYSFPEKFRPQKLGVVVKELRPVEVINVKEVINWYLSYSDSDTV